MRSLITSNLSQKIISAVALLLVASCSNDPKDWRTGSYSAIEIRKKNPNVFNNINSQIEKYNMENSALTEAEFIVRRSANNGGIISPSEVVEMQTRHREVEFKLDSLRNVRQLKFDSVRTAMFNNGIRR